MQILLKIQNVKTYQIYFSIHRVMNTWIKITRQLWTWKTGRFFAIIWVFFTFYKCLCIYSWFSSHLFCLPWEPAFNEQTSPKTFVKTPKSQEGDLFSCSKPFSWLFWVKSNFYYDKTWFNQLFNELWVISLYFQVRLVIWFIEECKFRCEIIRGKIHGFFILLHKVKFSEKLPI